MRILPDLNRAFALSCLLSAATTAFACDELPIGQSLWIRLAAPVSTYTAKVGDPIHAVLTQNLVCDNEIVLPMGTPVEGVVRSRRKVGWGIRHETAALEIVFTRALPQPGVTVPFTARIEEVENARENVHNGVIQGIRSSDTFQGTIDSRLIHLPTYNPYSDLILITYKVTFPIFPEPEIYYPAGTDIHLRTTTVISSPALTTTHESSPAPDPESDQLEQLVAQFPSRVTTTKDVNADLLNIVFLGSENQVKSAFREAGWHSADPMSRRTFVRNFYSILNNSGYAQEPMMTFFLNGRPEDMNWQKSLNSYGRRDHLRIWQWPTNSATNFTNNSVWISSSTHDTGAVLSVKYKGFVHHIAPDIDDERSTVIRDLNFAGCVKSVSYVPSSAMPAATHNAIGDLMRTDGSVAVITLQDCRRTDPQLNSNFNGGSFKAGNIAFRYIRKQILTFRNDIWRANIIYGMYDAGRLAFNAIRHHPVPPPTTDAIYPASNPPSSSSAQVSSP